MTDKARVSVVMPTFNRAHLVGRALASVAGQTYPDVEMVVVDDGSIDDTQDVVEGFARDSAVRVICLSQPNRGCAAARNRGLEAASGAFLAFLDSDDEWLPNAAEALAATLETTGADFTYSPAVEIYADGTERVNHPVAAARPERFAAEHFANTNVRNGAFMFRRHVLEAVPELDEQLRHNEDSDFLQRVAIRFRAAYCNTPTVRVHHHAGNKSSDRVEIYGALLRSAQRVLAENPAFRDELGRAADRRLRELRAKQVEALLGAGRYDEARTAAASSDGTFTLRLAAAMRTVLPLHARASLSRPVRRCLRATATRLPTRAGTPAATRRRTLASSRRAS